MIKGELISFGSFKTLVDAVHERDLLKSVNWDMDLAVEQEYAPPIFDEKDLPPFPEPRINKCRLKGGKFGFYGATHINRTKNGWQSKISINGHTTYLGSFADPISAQIIYLETKKEIVGII